MNNLNKEMSTIEINFEEYDKDTLIRFIVYAHSYDLTFNEAINKLLKDNLPLLEKDENQLPLL